MVVAIKGNGRWKLWNASPKNDWKVIARGDMGETGKWGENEDLLFLRL